MRPPVHTLCLALLTAAAAPALGQQKKKAAEAETDPELKEKLWKEYREYKENTRGGKS